jgi:hypothetical protein
MELYQSLYENTKNIKSKLEDHQIRNMLSTIPKLDEKGQETIFFLIRMFNINQVKDFTFNIPYESSEKKGEIEFDLDKFPNHLQQMLYMFVQMHYEYLSYETSRNG